MKLTIVRVEWLDARAEAGWVSGEPKNLPVWTFGILGEKTKDSQIIYSSYDPQEKQFGDRNIIPLGMVGQVTVLKEEEI